MCSGTLGPCSLCYSAPTIHANLPVTYLSFSRVGGTKMEICVTRGENRGQIAGYLGSYLHFPFLALDTASKHRKAYNAFLLAGSG